MFPNGVSVPVFSLNLNRPVRLAKQPLSGAVRMRTWPGRRRGRVVGTGSRPRPCLDEGRGGWPRVELPVWAGVPRDLILRLRLVFRCTREGVTGAVSVTAVPVVWEWSPLEIVPLFGASLSCSAPVFPGPCEEHLESRVWGPSAPARVEGRALCLGSCRRRVRYPHGPHVREAAGVRGECRSGSSLKRGFGEPGCWASTDQQPGCSPQRPLAQERSPGCS